MDEEFEARKKRTMDLMERITKPVQKPGGEGDSKKGAKPGDALHEKRKDIGDDIAAGGVADAESRQQNQAHDHARKKGLERDEENKRKDRGISRDR
jgi:hypothetical protein